ncbi:GGDEF domain-containing protein [Vibrio sp. TH_r3]|uniref:GGDEF domain-containing protein n=1 Tax=Vibrio sp. TH_r3 TaxID=3082084 RepID=UPI002952F8EC|nr:GGDEF domain-containing protein [Vibrio sp. TH_r3]MDV7103813.1 GGDEF domain-containing protein [Vibrio sp. TH_r3]
MASKDFNKAAQLLKATVPLMIKYQTPTTPKNYELWYTYVEKTKPELNRELDKIIEQYGFCSPSHTETLYQNHITGKRESNIRELKSSLEVLVNQVYLSMQDTLLDTETFEKSVESNVSDLAQIDSESISFDDLLSLVQKFVQNSKDVANSAQFFNKQMNTASTEITNLKRELQRVQNDALQDSLSGLFNRGAFDKDLLNYCSSEHHHPVSLILIDIDNFKHLNDSYGHVFGDLVIKAIANKLQTNCQDGYAAYRYGGEEFALLMPNTTIGDAERFAEILRQSIEKVSIKNKRSGIQVGNISASFGVSTLMAGQSPISIIDCADQQLYKAKNLGKNRVVSAELEDCLSAGTTA